MKKGIMMMLVAVLLSGCSTKESQDDVEKEGKGSYTNDKQEVTTAKIKMKNGNIDDVDIDETANGKDQTKKELKDAYNMKQASTIGKEWYQQIDFLEDYIEKHGVDIKTNGEGKAESNDVLSGCTIRIDGYLKAVKDAQANIK